MKGGIVVETNVHSIFECQNVEQIWYTIEMVREIDME